MSATDPQAAREYALEYLRRYVTNIDHGDVLDEMLTDERFAHLMSGDEDHDIATLDPIASEITAQAKTLAGTLSWPIEQPAAEHDGDSAADRVRRTANLRVANGYKTVDYDDEAVIAVLDNREQWRNLALSRGAGREPLRPEYGIRADFTDTTSAEFTVADNLADALRALDEFDARHGQRIVSRELVERPVGTWRKVGGDAT